MHRRILTAVTASVLILSACSATPQSRETSLKASEPAAPSSTSVANESRRAASGGAAASDSAAPARAAAPAPANAAQTGGAAAVTVPNLDRMIIRTVAMTLAVNEVPEAFRQVELIADSVGGSVTSSTFKQEGERTNATVVLRIPADQRSYNAAMEQLRKLAVRVPDESLSSQDVTEEFVDLESSLRNLQVTEARLVSLIERAQKVDEVIAVQRELTNVRGQIERIEGRKRFIERRSEFTTINLTLREVSAVPGGQPRGWSPAETFEEAVTALARALQGGARAAIWLIVWLPVYGLPLAASWYAIRFLRRQRAVRSGAA